MTALAAKGIEKQQYVFDEEDDNVPSETLGLMQREEELTAVIGISSSHNFLHLTLQEYLAAVHYSQQCDSPKRLSQILNWNGVIPLRHFLESYGKKGDKFSSSSATHWSAVLFLAGRTQLSGIDPNLLKLSLYSSVDVPLLHLLYETQCPQLIQSTLVTSTKYLSVSGLSGSVVKSGQLLSATRAIENNSSSHQTLHFSQQISILSHLFAIFLKFLEWISRILH